MLAFNLALFFGAIGWFISTIVTAAKSGNEAGLWALIPAGLLFFLAIILLTGHFTLQPNEARVQILFGAYKGTVRTSGFWWANPFYARSRGRVPVGVGFDSVREIKKCRHAVAN
jgi:hypothetical protein